MSAVDVRGLNQPVLLERWYLLTLACLLYAMNIADRYAVTTVLEPIRLDLGLSDAGVAFLTGVPLALFFLTFSIPVAWLADRKNRRNILIICLTVWSGFTLVCGSSQRYWQLLLGRLGVGIGEAGCTPVFSAILADHFAADRRPMAMALLALGAPIGAWLGADIAGSIAHALGWRAVFIALGAAGAILCVLFFSTVREPTRGQLDAGDDGRETSLSDSLGFLRRQRAAIHVIMGSGVSTLWGWGLMWWTPAYLMRAYGLNVGEAGAITGPIHLVAGALATLCTAWLLSRPTMVDPRRVLRVLAVGTGLATIPSFIAYWTHSLWIAKMMLWFYIPALYFYIGPCFGLLQNLAPPRMRALFFSCSGLVGTVFNLIIAPQAVGAVSDWLAAGGVSNAESLRLALMALAPAGLWAVLHYYLATRTILEDRNRARSFRHASDMH